MKHLLLFFNLSKFASTFVKELLKIFFENLSCFILHPLDLCPDPNEA